MSTDLLEGFQFVCNVDDVDDDDMEEFEVDGKPILIIKVDGQFYSMSAICSHEYARLSEGELEDGCVICPLHFSRFNLDNGKALDPPATQPINVYKLKVHEEELWVNVDSKEG